MRPENRAAAAQAATARLEVVGLECIRDERALFNGLNFQLEAGQALMVEGANGSGKTTLLRAVCGLVRPENGAIRWCGTDIAEIRLEYQADLAYLAHTHGVKEELTPLENLHISHALAGRPDVREPMDALRRVGMERLADLPVRVLSAGERRRVALARLLLSRARLWVLDEPFTALDKAGIRAVEALLADHCAGGGIALVSSHHPLSLACSLDTPIRLSP